MANPNQAPDLLQPHDPRDDAALAAIWRAAWASANPQVAQPAPHAHWLARVRAEFVPPVRTLVYSWQGVPAGFMAIDPAKGYLHQLHVAPAAQGRGLGGRMVEAACALCPQGWSLHVARTNLRAQAFYRRHGLAGGVASRDPVTQRERVAYHWRPGPAPVALPGP